MTESKQKEHIATAAPTGDVVANRVFYVILFMVSVWLLACAWYVRGEYGDGYQTIVNARYLFGSSDEYYVQRGPLFALLLVPLEAFGHWLGWSLTDVRPYHAFSALLHMAYLLGCWHLLTLDRNNRLPAVLAFVGGIMTVSFYANAAHLSHDLFPGLLFLYMILLCDRWLDRPLPGPAILLVLLGAAASLVKQTYALFWVAIIIYGVLAYVLRWDQRRVTGRKLLALGLLAALSGVISYLAYSLFLSQELPQTSFLLRPLRLVSAVSGQYAETFAGIFTPDLYLRNLHNYGLVAVLLVVPGLLFVYRSPSPPARLVAVCWLVCVLAMQAISFKEVRYLAFLAPLTAYLVLPVIAEMSKRRAAVAVVILLLVFDQVRGISTAVSQLRSTSTTNVSQFLDAPQGDGRVVSSVALTFVFLADSPLQRDPYHGIYHMTAELYKRLNLGEIQVSEVTDSKHFGRAGIEAGDRVFFANFALLRKQPWQENNSPASLGQLVTVAGTARLIELQRQGDTYARVANDGRFVMYIPAGNAAPQLPLITTNPLSLDAAANMSGRADYPATMSVIGVPVDVLCQADKCSLLRAAD